MASGAYLAQQVRGPCARDLAVAPQLHHRAFPFLPLFKLYTADLEVLQTH